jgi:hypothetical protein
MGVFSGCFFMIFCFNISSFDFVNNQLQCSISATIDFNTCIAPQFITINGIILYPSIVDLSLLFKIIDISWFQGQPYHPMIHQLF